MTQKEEKEFLKMLPRFKNVCCSKLCDNWESCKDKEDANFMACPWFFGYRMYGWPCKLLHDYSYNVKPFPDLRIEEASEETIKEWRNRK